MAISKDTQHVLLFSACLVIATAFRCFGVRRYKQEWLLLFGSLMTLFATRSDVMYYVVMVVGACYLIKSPCINTPRIIFIFCFLVKTVFELAEYLGLPREKNSLGKELMMMGSIKIIVVTYEIVEFRSGKKNDLASRSIFGVLSLEKEPSTYDLICFMALPFGLFTGPFCKFRTYSDMLKQPAYPPARKHFFKALETFVPMMLLYAILTPHRNYFTSQSFPTDPLKNKLLYICLVGLHKQLGNICAWMTVEQIFVLVGLGAYTKSSKPGIVQGPTVEFSTSTSIQGKRKDSEDEMDFETVRNADSTYFMIPSMSQGIKAWNFSVQWWLVHFVYRSEIIPRRKKFLRVALVFFVSGLWHGKERGYTWIWVLSLLVFAMDGACMFVHRNCIRGYWKRRLYLAFHLVFFKSFFMFNFACLFKLTTVDERSVSEFLRLTHYSCLIATSSITLLCGAIYLCNPPTKQKHS